VTDAALKYILTLSCHDVKGIVASVSDFLFKNEGFIIESAQFGDPSTGMFFMRTVFETPANVPEDALRERFLVVAEKFSMAWNLHDTRKKQRVLLMVSKQSHCYNDILHRYFTGSLPIEIPAVISNHRDLEEMTHWHKIPYYYMPVTAETKAAQEAQVLELVQKLDIDLVVLARYMQILSPRLSSKLYGRAINIHHSFLPSFKGAKPYHQAYDRGVKLIGATAHYVSDNLDEGPIIDQEVIRVDHTHTPAELVALGCDVENQVLARAMKYFLEQRIILNGNKTVVFR
jgi:formyltetrahydrofolate deformylase